MEKSYSPKDWAKKDNKAIKGGVNAVKRKVHNTLYNVDDLMTRRIPDSSEKLLSTLKKGGKKVAQGGKRGSRVVKAAASQGKRSILEVLKKLFK